MTGLCSQVGGGRASEQAAEVVYHKDYFTCQPSAKMAVALDYIDNPQILASQ